MDDRYDPSRSPGYAEEVSEKSKSRHRKTKEVYDDSAAMDVDHHGADDRSRRKDKEKRERKRDKERDRVDEKQDADKSSSKSKSKSSKVEHEDGEIVGTGKDKEKENKSESQDRDRSRDKHSEKKSKEKDKEKGKEKEKDRSKEKEKREKEDGTRDKDEKDRERTKEKDKPKEREREHESAREKRSDRDKEKHEKDKEKAKNEKARDADRDRDESRSREKDRDRAREKEVAPSRDYEYERQRERSPVDRTRTRDRERSPVDRSRDSGRSREKERDKYRDESPEEAEEGEVTVPKAVVQDSGGEISMSIEETNRIRASLGLKPLQMGEDPKKAKEREEQQKEAEKRRKDMEAAEMLDRIERAKNKRLLHAKIGGKSIAEELAEEEDSAAAWVEKSRKLEVEKQQREKELAQLRARMFEEQDAAIENEEEDDSDSVAARRRRAQASLAYSSRDLAGLKIAHDLGEINEDEVTILTLKDKSILGKDDLNDDEDELENIKLIEKEKIKKNIAIRTQRKDYKGYDDDEFDPNKAGEKKVLAKYDEDEEKKGLRLGEGGAVDEARDKRFEAIRSKLKAADAAAKMTYDVADIKLEKVSDYYTADEMAAFRKPKTKKKKKIRKKTSELFADLEEEDDEQAKKDRGSRSAREAVTKDKEQKEASDKAQRFNRALEKANEASRTLAPAPLPVIEDEEDELDQELQKSLARARRIASKELTVPKPDETVAAAVALARQKDEEKEKDGDSKDKIIFTQTSEFCRNIEVREAELEARAAAAAAASSRKGADPESDADVDMENADVADGNGDGVKSVSSKGKSPAPKPSDAVPAARGEGSEKGSDEEDMSFMSEEPLVGNSLAATLSLLKQKGLLEEKQAGRSNDKIIRVNEPDAKGKTIRLEYLDEYGRQMTPKEAFRQLSHKFHGKMPGKMKQEKRMKQYEEEMKMKQMSSIDTPLMTLHALQSQQMKNQTPYVVLSGNTTAKPQLPKTTAPAGGGGFQAVKEERVDSVLGGKKVSLGIATKRKGPDAAAEATSKRMKSGSGSEPE